MELMENNNMIKKLLIFLVLTTISYSTFASTSEDQKNPVKFPALYNQPAPDIKLLKTAKGIICIVIGFDGALIFLGGTGACTIGSSGFFLGSALGDSSTNHSLLNLMGAGCAAGAVTCIGCTYLCIKLLKYGIREMRNGWNGS